MVNPQPQIPEMELFKSEDYEMDIDLMFETISTKGSGIYLNKQKNRVEAWLVKDSNIELVGISYMNDYANQLGDEMERYWQLGFVPEYEHLH